MTQMMILIIHEGMIGMTSFENTSKRLLRANEVADILNVSRAMAYKLMQRGMIPTVHIGNSKRVRPADLQNYIRDNRISSNRG
jgi:excisionase family DNA binding protein